MSTLPTASASSNPPPIHTKFELTLLESALLRVREGILLIHPLHDTTSGKCSCGGKAGDKCSPGKHPHLDGYKKKATDDPQIITDLWTQFPNANIGGVVKSGFCILDVDLRHAGDVALLALENRYGPLPPTVTVKTATDGRHVYFKLPPGFIPPSQTKQIEGHGIELLMAGSNLVLVGSMIRGVPYEYVPGQSPCDLEIAELPQWIVDRIGKSSSSSPTYVNPSTGRMKRIVPSSIPNGTRHITLSSIAGTFINSGVRADDLAAQLVNIDRKHCQPPLGPRETEALAASMEKTHESKPQTDEWKIKNRGIVLDILDCALCTEWSGRTGNAEFSILFAVLSVAHESGSLSLEISYREIAERACVTLSTVAKRIHQLVERKWIGIRATYKERLAFLYSHKASREELANASTVFDVIPLPHSLHKANINPTAPLLFALCRLDVLRVRGLGMNALKLLAVLMRQSFPSIRELANAARMNESTVSRKVKKMKLVKLVKEGENGIELVDLSAVNFEETAQLLGTAGRGKIQRDLHASQREKNRKEYWKLDNEEQHPKLYEGTPKTPYLLNDDLPSNNDAVSTSLVPVTVETWSPILVDDPVFPLDGNKMFVEMVLNLLGGEIVNKSQMQRL